jgi:hypothetical protein
MHALRGKPLTNSSLQGNDRIGVKYLSLRACAALAPHWSLKHRVWGHQIVTDVPVIHASDKRLTSLQS